MNSLRRFAWTVRTWTDRLQWTHGVLLAAMAILLVTECLVVWPARAALSAKADELQATQQTEQVSRAAVRSVTEPREQLDRFHDRFPLQKSLPDLLEKLLTLGIQMNLFPTQGDYRLTAVQGLDLMRYDVTVPLKGSYPAIRTFVAQALWDVPTMALQGITFSKDSATSGTVDAQVRWVIYVRKDPA